MSCDPKKGSCCGRCRREGEAKANEELRAAATSLYNETAPKARASRNKIRAARSVLAKLLGIADDSADMSDFEDADAPAISFGGQDRGLSTYHCTTCYDPFVTEGRPPPGWVLFDERLFCSFNCANVYKESLRKNPRPVFGDVPLDVDQMTMTLIGGS